jgi:hypothetical protein
MESKSIIVGVLIGAVIVLLALLVLSVNGSEISLDGSGPYVGSVLSGALALTGAYRAKLFGSTSSRPTVSFHTPENPQVVLPPPRPVVPEIIVPGQPEQTRSKIDQLLAAFEVSGYQVYDDGSKPYNVNVFGIRQEMRMLNRFDDIVGLLWMEDGYWQIKEYQATTDPGATSLATYDEEKIKGTAILKEGQYPDSHIIDKHRNVYNALVQRGGPVTVIRDFNRDDVLDYDTGIEETGYFGINIHRANPNVRSVQVDRWSAGCQVIADPSDFAQFMDICELSKRHWGNSFTYTLFNQDEIYS